MIDTVVFDLGGVLIDWHPRHLLRHVADGPAATDELIVALDIVGAQEELDRGVPPERVRSRWRERYAEHADIVERYFDQWDETIAGALDDVVAILDELRFGPVRLYALSNWSGDLFRRNRARFTFLDWFDGLMISGDEQITKPDPRIYALLAERFDIDPPTAVFIDDRQDNVEAARDSGFVGVVFTSAAQLRHDLGRLEVLGVSGEQRSVQLHRPLGDARP
jgi:2-haloacid dehalogenase